MWMKRKGKKVSVFLFYLYYKMRERLQRPFKNQESNFKRLQTNKTRLKKT